MPKTLYTLYASIARILIQKCLKVLKKGNLPSPLALLLGVNADTCVFYFSSAFIICRIFPQLLLVSQSTIYWGFPKKMAKQLNSGTQCYPIEYYNKKNCQIIFLPNLVALCCSKQKNLLRFNLTWIVVLYIATFLTKCVYIEVVVIFYYKGPATLRYHIYKNPRGKEKGVRIWKFWLLFSRGRNFRRSLYCIAHKDRKWTKEIFNDATLNNLLVISLKKNKPNPTIISTSSIPNKIAL